MKDFETDDKLGLVVSDFKDFLHKEFPPRDMLLSPWLESQSLSMIYAARGVGKTHFALNIAHALATGGSFLGWQATAPTPVLYIDGEMPAPSLQERLELISKASGIDPAPDMFRIVSRDAQPFGVMPNLATSEGQELISESMGNARVIILDNLSSLVYGAKENEAEGWEPIAQWAIRQRALGKSLIFVHHAGKNGVQRGTSKREDLLDISISLKRPTDYCAVDGARFEVHFEKARSLYGTEAEPFEVCLDSSSGLPEWRVTGLQEDTELLAMHEEGLSYTIIGERLGGINKSTVKRRLDRLKAKAA